MSGQKTGLQYLEYEIARSQRRIDKIKAQPDPTRPKSNLLLYEMDLELRQEQWRAVVEGKPPFGFIFPGPLTRAMGMVPWDGVLAADRSYGEAAHRYFDTIRREGLAEHTCDRTIVLVPMVMQGDFPKPDFLTPVNIECIPVYHGHLLLAKLLGIPYYSIDRPFEGYARMGDDAKLKYVTDQLGDVIEYVEANVPGCKYDEDKLIELHHYNRQYVLNIQKLYELKKKKPCPIAGREAFRQIRPPDWFPNPAKVVEYTRNYVEEIGERAERGEGAVEGEERLRLLWSVSGPYYADPFTWLGKRGVAVPAVEMTIYNGWGSGREPISGDLWNGRRLTPLEEEARTFDLVWGRLGSWWVQAHLDTCRDLDLEGIVYFMQTGCPTAGGLATVVSKTVERELGIPTLLLEGRMLDESTYDERDFLGKLEDFVNLCLERKPGAHR